VNPKDNANNESLEPTPVFESTPSQSNSASSSSVPESIQEETPDDLTASDIGGVDDTTDIPAIDESAFNDDSGSKKKVFFIVGGIVMAIVVFALILSVLFGLRKGSASHEKITLEYWGLWEDPEVMNVVIGEYKRMVPNVSIKYIKQDPKNYREKLLARGKEGRGPDLFRFHNTWLPTLTELVAPLPKTVMTNKEFEETFYKVAQNDLKIDDDYHGLPLMIDGLVLVYNKDLFANIGVKTPPKTWEDVINVANELRVKDDQDNVLTSGIALGTANNIEHFSDIFGWMLIQNGADLTHLNSPNAVEVLRNYRQFAEPPFSYWSAQLPNNINAFTQGQVGMIIVPSWQILEIKKANNDLHIGVAPLPVLPGGEQVSLANYWVEGVSKTSKHQKEAWAFLHFLVQKETMTTLYQEQTKTRLFGEPYSRVDLKDKLIQNEYIGPVLSQAASMKSLPVISRTYDTGINDEISKYIENAINATEKGVDYDQAMATASQGITQVLTKYGIK
jgi:multiple sugar transport system substrate-binding protein